MINDHRPREPCGRRPSPHPAGGRCLAPAVAIADRRLGPLVRFVQRAFALAKFRAQLESVRAVMGVLRPTELLDHVVEVMGLRQHYLDGTPQGEARIENINELRGLADRDLYRAGQACRACAEPLVASIGEHGTLCSPI